MILIKHHTCKIRLNRIKQSSHMKNKISFFFILMVIAFIFHYYYRPFIYKNHIFDYHFSDFFPSLISVPGLYAFQLLVFEIRKKENMNPYKLVTESTIGFIIYECIQLLGYGFDWWDIAATFVGSGLTYLFIFLSNKNEQIKKTKTI